MRFHEKLKYYPPVGTILNSKGPKGENRYAPAIHVKSSSDILFENVVIHHALGMGFLMERSENAMLLKCDVRLKEGSLRVVSAIADATHFCNCKGEIIEEVDELSFGDWDLLNEEIHSLTPLNKK